MNFKIALGVVAVTATALFSAPTFAKGSGGGRTSHSGATHSNSHGGHYQGSSGSSHKGGTYVSPKGDNQYGKHKK
ncbi:hypothetical protein [Acidovorax sp. FG27]|uniref:hypothetical protein n=1 Tax=Acidovorax sp. FG27 TaxID=3133652 RepID=UPI0030E991BA